MKALFLAMILVSCGNTSSGKGRIHVPKDSYLVGFLKKDSDEMVISHFWFGGNAVRIRPCLIRGDFSFDKKDFRKYGFVKTLSCGQNYDIDARVLDQELHEWFRPSYEGYVLLKTEYDFEYPYSQIEKKILSGKSSDITDFINELKKQGS